jgi:small-conductance mechanosensitive channel
MQPGTAMLSRMAEILELLRRPFELGSLRVSVLSVLVGLGLFVVLLLAVRIARRTLRNRILPRAGLTPAVAIATSTLAGYALMVLGTLVILPVMLPGFNLDTLSLMLGAVSLGVGFGLRNIADNFMSGLILLVERPIKIGDRIDVGGLEGQVIEIRARSTTVRTNDNVDIIVPNSEFVSNRVTNLSHNDNVIRFRIPVGVHYKSDVRQVESALLAAARGCADVLDKPEPQVRFMGFGDSSLDFELRVWSESLHNRPNKLRSQVNFRIWEEFKRQGIEIPYPQRDLYVKEFPAPTAPRPNLAEPG